MNTRCLVHRALSAAVALVVALPAGAAGADAEAHVAGTGAVAAGTCATALNVHATELGHPGQFLDLWMVCGEGPREVHVEGGPDCISQEGTVAYLSYTSEELRLVISDGGVGTDLVAVAAGPFKKASPANKCRAAQLEPTAAVGDFVVGLP
jgi:hypothetical protein